MSTTTQSIRSVPILTEFPSFKKAILASILLLPLVFVMAWGVFPGLGLLMLPSVQKTFQGSPPLGAEELRSFASSTRPGDTKLDDAWIIPNVGGIAAPPFDHAAMKVKPVWQEIGDPAAPARDERAYQVALGAVQYVHQRYVAGKLTQAERKQSQKMIRYAEGLRAALKEGQSGKDYANDHTKEGKEALLAAVLLTSWNGGPGASSRPVAETTVPASEAPQPVSDTVPAQAVNAAQALIVDLGTRLQQALDVRFPAGSQGNFYQRDIHSVDSQQTLTLNDARRVVRDVEAIESLVNGDSGLGSPQAAPLTDAQRAQFLINEATPRITRQLGRQFMPFTHGAMTQGRLRQQVQITASQGGLSNVQKTIQLTEELEQIR